MKWPVTRSAAWRWKPVPVRARPGCWCRAWCVRCWKGVRRKIFWPLLSPKKRRAKCANACMIGWCSFPKLVMRNWVPSCGCAASCKSPRQRNCWACGSCTPACCKVADRCRYAPSTAGLRPCCAARLWRYCKSWACLQPMNSWKTTRGPWPRCGGAFRPVWPKTHRPMPTTWLPWPPMAATKRTRRWKALWANAWNFYWPTRRGW